MFMAALFTIAKAWKQPACPLASEWISKMQSIHTVEYYLALKRKGFLTPAAVQRDLQYLMLSEISQSQKNRFSV